MPKSTPANPAELEAEKEEFDNTLAKTLGTLEMMNSLKM